VSIEDDSNFEAVDLVEDCFTLIKLSLKIRSQKIVLSRLKSLYKNARHEGYLDGYSVGFKAGENSQEKSKQRGKEVRERYEKEKERKFGASMEA